MTPRRRLANRRASTTFSFKVGGLAYVATASRYPDGAVGEIFLSNHKSSTATCMRTTPPSSCSIALQHGADPEVIRRALCRNGDGSAFGPLAAALNIIAADQGFAMTAMAILRGCAEHRNSCPSGSRRRTLPAKQGDMP